MNATASLGKSVNTEGGRSLVVQGFARFGGLHCETSALKKILDHANISYSEEFLFGTGGGIGFVFWRTAKDPVPFVGGRNGKFPEFVMRAGEGIGQRVKVIKSGSEKRAYELLIAELSQGRPVVCYGDIMFLPYFHVSRHFGGHAFVVYGVDETRDRVLISDRGARPQTVSLGDLARARNSKTSVFAPKNSQLRVSFNPTAKTTGESVRKTIQATCDAMLRPPISNFGLLGLERFRSYMEYAFGSLGPRQLCDLAIATYVNLELAGTGGSAFRRMYRRFLEEAAGLSTALPVTEAMGWIDQSIAAWKRLIDGLLPPVGPAVSRLRRALDEKERAFEQGGPEGTREGARCQIEIEQLHPSAAEELSDHRDDLIEATRCIHDIRRHEAACFRCLDRSLE